MNKIKNPPIYDLVSDYKVNIESISHVNPYNFNEFHRHNYYEVLVFEKGGGYQQIDFNRIPIRDYSCYIVKPGQIHLVRKATKADGILIQFTETMILSDVFLSALSFLKPISSSEVLFEQDKNLTKELLYLIQSINLLQDKKAYFFKEKTAHLLSNLLYYLEESSPNFDTKEQSVNGMLAYRFTELVALNLNSISINEYCKELNISNKKLAFLVKEQLNTTPLKYIHSILLLGIKRDMVFKELSFKEIAFNYNFDSSSNFSIFIKKHTGKTPSQLQTILSQIRS